MASARANEFLQLGNLPVMYELTKAELCYVARKLNVELTTKKKAEMQEELKEALMEREWFKGDGEEGESDNGGDEENEMGDTNVENLDLNGLSSSEKFELMKLQLQLKIEKVKQGAVKSGVRENRNVDNSVHYVPEFVEGEEENFFLQFEKNCKTKGMV